MRNLLCLVALLLFSLGCRPGAAGCDQSSTNPPPTHRDSNLNPVAAPRDSTASVRGFRIASVEARLYTSDSTPVSPNIIDNAQVSLFNVAQLRLRISVTVRWAPQEKRVARIGLWARANGKEVFAQDVDLVPRPDSTVHVQDFWLDHGDCDGLLILAYVGAGRPESEAYRYIPYECAD